MTVNQETVLEQKSQLTITNSYNLSLSWIVKDDGFKNGLLKFNELAYI